jgi:uncharacterized membrane protein YdjX (TVP38/TMEM64 family)
MARFLRRVASALVARRGDRRWDVVIRGTALAATLAIPIVHFFPATATLVGFAVAAVLANGPLSPVVPVAFEPLIMEAAKHVPVVEVTLVGLGAYMYTEYLNWHLYRWVLDRERLAALRRRRWVERSVVAFGRAPFLTTLVFAFTPLPFWVVRILAIYRGYAVARFMGATALGRLPRIFLYAWLGAALSLPAVFLGSIAVGATLLVVVVRLLGREKVLKDAALDAPSTTETADP